MSDLHWLSGSQPSRSPSVPLEWGPCPGRPSDLWGLGLNKHRRSFGQTRGRSSRWRQCSVKPVTRSSERGSPPPPSVQAGLPGSCPHRPPKGRSTQQSVDSQMRLDPSTCELARRGLGTRRAGVWGLNFSASLSVFSFTRWVLSSRLPALPLPPTPPQGDAGLAGEQSKPSRAPKYKG